MSRDVRIEALIGRIAMADFGQGSADELRALERYLEAHPEQAAQHMAVMALWEELGELNEPAPVEQFAPEPSRSRLNWHLLAAAMVPFFAIIAALLFTLDHSGSPDVLDLRTGPGERRIVSLADGSTVTLGPSSQVMVELREKSRELALAKGEAMFEVSHDPARAFTVAAGGGEVRAIGTAFNIRLTIAAVVVTVAEGTISVTTGQKAKERGGDAANSGLAQLARAGEQVTYGGRRLGERVESGAFISTARVVDVARYTGWSKGLLRFDGEPLSVVVDEVNRYALEQVRIVDLELGRIPIYGVLHVGDTKGLVSIVQDSQGLSNAELERKVTILKRTAESSNKLTAPAL